MDGLKTKLERCEREEQELRFAQFGVEEAAELGWLLYEMADEEKHPVALDIDLAGFQVFHICMKGAAPYNNL